MLRMESRVGVLGGVLVAAGWDGKAGLPAVAAAALEMKSRICPSIPSWKKKKPWPWLTLVTPWLSEDMGLGAWLVPTCWALLEP